MSPNTIPGLMVLFFRHLKKIPIPCSLHVFFRWEISFEFFPLNHFSVSALEIFPLSSIFKSLTIVYLGVHFGVFILFEAHFIHWIYMFMSFVKFGNFSPMISLSTFSACPVSPLLGLNVNGRSFVLVPQVPDTTLFNYWRIFMMAALKSLLSNSDISVISVLPSIDCLFSFSYWDSWSSDTTLGLVTAQWGRNPVSPLGRHWCHPD